MRVAIGTTLLMLLTLVTAFSIRAAWNMYGRFDSSSTAAAAAKNELASLQAQYSSTTAQLEALKTPRGEEGALRERYGVARPGEGQIDIVRESTASEDGEGNSQDAWSKLWRSLFDW